MFRFLCNLLGAGTAPRTKRRSVKLGLENLGERVLPAVSPLGDPSGFTYGERR